MIELSEHLLDLVFRQKSAIIPEFGTFKFVATGARMNFGENLLSPPTQTLVFTESTFDEGDLSFLDFLVKEKGFDPHEASIRIKAYVHQIRNNLRQLNYSYLPGFGTIHQLENEALKFTPGDKIKAMKPTMGLPDLTVYPISREFVKEEILETEVATSTFIDNRSEKVSSEKNRWAAPALVAFLVLGLGLIAYYFYINNFRNDDPDQKMAPVAQINEDSMLLAVNGFRDSTILLDSVSDKTAMIEEIDNQEIVTENKKTPATSDLNVNKQKTTVPEEQITKAQTDPEEVINTSEGKTCAIIVGAMGNPANAKKLAKTVRSKGFTPFSFKSKGLTKVGASCNCDSESIENTLEAMKKINNSAWVYESE